MPPRQPPNGSARWRTMRPVTVSPSHKTLKNKFSSRNVWESIRDVKTVGVIQRDDARGLVEIAWPVGVVAALSPSTNPTSTVIFKTLIAVKARNAIIHAPHPSAVNCLPRGGADHGRGGRGQRGARQSGPVLGDDKSARHAGAHAPQTHQSHPGHRRLGDGAGCPLGRQARLRRRPGQCALLR